MLWMLSLNKVQNMIIERVINCFFLESRVHHQQHQPQQTQACMYSNEAQGLPVTTAQGTASPAVIYLEAMMSQIPQQPTYISPVHPTVQFLPGGYQASTYQTAPDGSIHGGF